MCIFGFSILFGLALPKWLQAAENASRINTGTLSMHFYPRDAMLARVLAMDLFPCPSVSVCLSVCLSVTSRYSVKRDERINLILAWRLFSTSPTLCFKEIQVSINSGLTKFRHGISFVERAINSARERLTLRTSDKLDSRWSVKLIVPRSSDAGPL